jgi:hypothetical protein
MWKSVKGNVNEQLAREVQQWVELQIYLIHAAMEVLVYVHEKLPTSKWKQSQVRLNGAWQATTKWSEADCDRAIE